MDRPDMLLALVLYLSNALICSANIDILETEELTVASGSLQAFQPTVHHFVLCTQEH